MTIPRLELIAAHMATNLAANIKEALPSQNIRSLTCWTDSTVALQRLKDKGVGGGGGELQSICRK